MKQLIRQRWRLGLSLCLATAWSAVGLALFTNGGFESGSLTGWTTSHFVNNGLTGTAPFTQSSIVRTSGGFDSTRVVGAVGAGPLSTADAVLGTSASLRVPRYGDFAAVVNADGINRNANAIKQSAVVAQSDVDPLDGRIHVRFAFAPVMSASTHSAAQQPWIFLAVRNKSRGNAVLYQSFAYSGQAGIPWKTSNSYLYTDWQVVDITPNAASLAVGDEIELEAIAAGCSLSGHAAWMYVDAFGAFLPGPSVVATAPTLVNAGDQLTYALTARNQGASDLANGVVRFGIPANTSFVSVADTANCSHAAGVVTCNVGSLATGAHYATDVTVAVGNVAAGTVIAAGNYGIEGTGEPMLLGPVVNTIVTGVALVDLSIAITNGVSSVTNGQAVTYTITARNASATSATGATVSAAPPVTLTGAHWTCVATAGAACTAAGTGPIGDTVNLPGGATATYTLTGTVSGLAGTLSMAASIAPPSGVSEGNPSDNAASDHDPLAVNGPPIATADAYTVAEDGILTVDGPAGVLANDSDPDADTLTASLLSTVSHGTLALAPNGGFVYTPARDFFGIDSFTYTTSDGSASSSPATVLITVTPVNDPPTLDQPLNLTVPWSAGPQLVTLTGISPGSGENEPVTVAATSGAPGVVAATPVTYAGGATATFTLMPTTLQQGVVTVSVVVSDGAASVVRTFTITVVSPPFYLTHIYPASGPASGGTHIRLYGAGFRLPAPSTGPVGSATPVVLINGVPATVVVVESDSVVSALTPALPAGNPLDVQLLLPGGAGTLVRAYTPFELPPPVEPTEPNRPTPVDPTLPTDPTAPTMDTDDDGMPDVWEIFYGLDPRDPADASGDPDGDGSPNLEEYQRNTHPRGRHARYFAEGNAQGPFGTWVNVYNPSPFDAAVLITFYLDDASVVSHLARSRAGARLTVDTAVIPALQGHAFGMRIETDEVVAIDRTITWSAQGVGATAEAAVVLSSTWYFAEGATHQHLQTFLLLTNPSEADIVADVEYLISSAGVSTSRTHLVPAHSRLTVWVNQEGPEFLDQGFGTVVRASAPLVAERATYIVSGSSFDAGETSVGSPVTSTDWYFAEGSSGPYFDTFLLLANPGDAVADVQVTYLTDHGDPVVRTHTVGPRSRVTVPIDAEAAWDGWTGLGMHVSSTNGVAIVAERAMWWSTDDDAGWEEGHGSGGLTAPATSFALGDGVAGGAYGASTYLLLANPGGVDATVRVTLAFDDGIAPVSRDVLVPAGRRVTLNAEADFPGVDGRRFSARVDSLDGVPIVVEESIYWTMGRGTWKTGVSLPANRLP